MRKHFRCSIRFKYLFIVGLAAIPLIGLAHAAGLIAPTHRTELEVSVSVSEPANGTHFEAGEQPTVTVVLSDTLGTAVTPDAYSRLNLYM